MGFWVKKLEVKPFSLSKYENRSKCEKLLKNSVEFNDNLTKNVEIKKETQELRPKSKVRKENYIHIPGWAVCELGLKGNELLIYAIIFGFSQEENQTFRGSLRYLMDWTNSSKVTVIKTLKTLLEKDLIGKIERFDNGIKFCDYYVKRTKEQKVVLSTLPVVKKLNHPGKETLPHNIGDNIGTNSINRISKVSKKEQLEQVDVSQKKEKNNSVSISEKKKNKKKNINSSSISKPKKTNKKVQPKPISFDEIIDAYTENEDLRTELKEHLKTRKQKKAALTNRALELSLKKLDSLADSDEEKIQIVQNSIMNGWIGFFELNEKDKNKLNNHSSYNLNEYEKAMDTFENKSGDDDVILTEKEREEEFRKDLLFEGYKEIAPGVFQSDFYQNIEFLNEESRIAYEKNGGNSS